MKFELTILGCNSAIPTAYRYQTAQVINVSERFFLIDCGEATQIQLRRFKIPFNKINHIFISHLHGDHFIGLPGLISSFSLLGRTKDLHIYGHKPLQEYLDFHTQFFGGTLGFQLVFHEIESSEQALLYEDKTVSIYSFPLEHGDINCHGFLFKERQKARNLKKEMLEFYQVPIKSMQALKNGEDFTTSQGEIIPNNRFTCKPVLPRSYAYCSDTAYAESLLQYIKQVDLLYHEATFCEEEALIAQKVKHSTAQQAGQIAKLAQAKQLLIGHYSARYPDINMLEKEAQAIFPNTIAVKDGDVFSINQTTP